MAKQTYVLDMCFSRPKFWVHVAQILVVCAVALSCVTPCAAQERLSLEAQIAPAKPDTALASEMFGVSGRVVLLRQEVSIPGWQVSTLDGTNLGYIGSSWEIARTVGYSGRPIDMLVAITSDAKIASAKLMAHSEPILTLGLSDSDIANFVHGFSGVDLNDPTPSLDTTQKNQLDIISRATVSTGVIRDAILRVGRELALSRDILDQGRINRLMYAPHTWQELRDDGSVVAHNVTLREASKVFSDATVPVPANDGDFLQIFVAVLDPPEIGRNLLGQQAYTRAVGALPNGTVALFVGSRGLYSHRGTKWRRSGVFDRLKVLQDGVKLDITSDGYTRIDTLFLKEAPELKERSVFHIAGEGFDPTKSFRLEVTATRPAKSEDISLVMGVDYILPEKFVLPEAQAPKPLWEQTWHRKKFSVIGLGGMLFILTAILFLQEGLVRRRKFWFPLRIGFLCVSFVWLGLVVNGQLSVVQVVAFVQSLLNGFRWETFLIDPIIFVLWSFVALGMLFWGRGVYCGWLCPFGALQELVNLAARRLGIKQIEVPHALHERLWVIKYTLFIAILALSFYSMKHALLLAEAEPFKTAISLRMMRALPFVLFVLILLVGGLFIERFYCRYLCPLGAALAIPAKLKIFDWLRRRPQCGRECRLCQPKCTVGAIDPLGRINPNECVLCLRCQVIFNDDTTCPTLKRRARAAQSGAK